MRIRNLAPALLLGLVLRAAGAWTLVASDEISSNAPCRHIRLRAEESATGDEADLHLALCDGSKTTLRVIDQPNEPRNNLAKVMKNEQCLAGVNGGYFAPDYGVVGLLISGGQVIAPLRKARLLSGVLSVANGRVRLQRRAEFSLTNKVSDALQCGPFLVDHGRAVNGLDDSRNARRTFVATGNANRFLLGVSAPVSLAELPRILLAGKIADDLKIDRALNLDGGSSSAFWFRDGPTPFSIPEQKTVRNFLSVVAK